MMARGVRSEVRPGAGFDLDPGIPEYLASTIPRAQEGLLADAMGSAAAGVHTTRSCAPLACVEPHCSANAVQKPGISAEKRPLLEQGGSRPPAWLVGFWCLDETSSPTWNLASTGVVVRACQTQEDAKGHAKAGSDLMTRDAKDPDQDGLSPGKIRFPCRLAG
ncbi:hypothetical protein C8034_v009191 [Colletotrichum sidae]|uniref:Uncharacterized protein n=1 Tax=Colletotrichum sidae TaxID=1347389 RepID=A0A4R8TNK2_9PEZI|nr:hypothetical protein C8034_v009191 [Colletotrichum sidae]